MYIFLLIIFDIYSISFIIIIRIEYTLSKKRNSLSLIFSFNKVNSLFSLEIPFSIIFLYSSPLIRNVSANFPKSSSYKVDVVLYFSFYNHNFYMHHLDFFSHFVHPK